jgi:hypothetical protein
MTKTEAVDSLLKDLRPFETACVNVPRQ